MVSETSEPDWHVSSFYHALTTAGIALLGALAVNRHYSATLAHAGESAAAERGEQLLAATLLSLCGYAAATRLVPLVARSCLNAKARLWGRDINKSGDSKVPESAGLGVGIVYIVCVLCFQPFFRDMLGEYNAGVCSICFMLLLGFADDVLDLRWAVKIALSAVATLPLLVGYNGPTNIVVPVPFRAMLGASSLHLGWLYHAYLLLVAVFSTNAINIYAGINGLEVGQTLILAVSMALHNIAQMARAQELQNGESVAHHTLSFVLMLPFVAVASALFAFNRYPSRVFVGDSFTYFAGMSLAVAGILGHFSKTMLLFSLPQLINFTLSLPQLLRIVPCPRHRVPTLNKETGLLENSGNLTLINAFLYIFGPMHEQTLTQRLLVFQIFCSALAFVVRYYFAYVLYDEAIL